MQPSALSFEMLDALVARAKASPRRRQHLNIHASYEEPCQRLCNALCRDTYIPPHRHRGVSDEETLVAVRGAFAAIIFDENGAIDYVMRCGEGYEHIGVVIPVGRWHTALPLTETVVIFEVKAGPFDPSKAKEPAPWAPGEGNAAIDMYQAQLKQMYNIWLAGQSVSAGASRWSDGADAEGIGSGKGNRAPRGAIG